MGPDNKSALPGALVVAQSAIEATIAPDVYIVQHNRLPFNTEAVFRFGEREQNMEGQISERFQVGSKEGVIVALPTLSSAIETMRELSRRGNHRGLYTEDTAAPAGRSCLWVPELPVKCISRERKG
jgi:hypothetical protein